MEASHLTDNELRDLASAMNLVSRVGNPSLGDRLQLIIDRHSSQPQCASTQSFNGWLIQCDDEANHSGGHGWVGNNGHLTIRWDRG